MRKRVGCCSFCDREVFEVISGRTLDEAIDEAIG